MEVHEHSSPEDRFFFNLITKAVMRMYAIPESILELDPEPSIAEYLQKQNSQPEENDEKECQK